MTDQAGPGIQTNFCRSQCLIRRPYTIYVQTDILQAIQSLITCKETSLGQRTVVLPREEGVTRSK